MPVELASRSHCLERMLPAFCAMAVVLVLTSPALFPSPGLAAGVYAAIGLSAIGFDFLARRHPRWDAPLVLGGAVGLLITVYLSVSLLAQWLLPEDREWFLLRLDRRSLGYTWEGAWSGLANPLLTDFLQVIYTSFYLLPVVLCAALIRRRDWWGLASGLDRVVLCFLVSYCGYLLVPTRSPYPFVEYAEVLPTLGLQPLLHHGFVESSITKRDCFPSGHTMVSFYVAWLAWQRLRPLFWVLGPWALLTAVATLYLRYHYLVDVIAGVAGFLLYSVAARWIFGPFASGEEMGPEPVSAP